MWSYKYTSSASVVTGNCRVGVRLEVATSTSHMVDLFTAAAKEQVLYSQAKYILKK